MTEQLVPDDSPSAVLAKVATPAREFEADSDDYVHGAGMRLFEALGQPVPDDSPWGRVAQPARDFVAAYASADLVVVAQCVSCHAERDVRAGEVPEGGQPTCHRCGELMVARRAVKR